MRSLKWTLLIWEQPELELVLGMELRNCDPGSGWGNRRVQPAAKVLEEPVEEWRSWRVERHEAAIVDERSGGNRLRPSDACVQGCGRRFLLLDKTHLLEESGSAAGRRRGSLTEGAWSWVAGGENLGMRASPGWAGLWVG